MVKSLRLRRLNFTALGLLLMAIFIVCGGCGAGEDTPEVKKAKELSRAIDTYLYENKPDVQAAQKLYDEFRSLPNEEAVDIERAKAATTLIYLYGYLNKGEILEKIQPVYESLDKISHSSEVDVEKAKALRAAAFALSIERDHADELEKISQRIQSLANTPEVDEQRAELINYQFWDILFNYDSKDRAHRKFAEFRESLNKLADTPHINNSRGSFIINYMNQLLFLRPDDATQLEPFYEDIMVLPDSPESEMMKFYAIGLMASAYKDVGNQEASDEMLKKLPDFSAFMRVNFDDLDYEFGKIGAIFYAFELYKGCAQEEKSVEHAQLLEAFYPQLLAKRPFAVRYRIYEEWVTRSIFEVYRQRNDRDAIAKMMKNISDYKENDSWQYLRQEMQAYLDGE